MAYGETENTMNPKKIANQIQGEYVRKNSKKNEEKSPETFKETLKVLGKNLKKVAEFAKKFWPSEANGWIPKSDSGEIRK